jgi:flagellar basal-body rod modification protein FlgD
MAAIDALNTAQSTTGAGGLSSLSSGDFFKLILTELTKQDPLAPNDTNSLLQQISSVRSIQSDMDLSQDLGALVQQNEFAAAATLVGKTVSGVDENYARVTGEVKSITRTQQGTMLILKTGERIPAGNLDEITQTIPDEEGEG